MEPGSINRTGVSFSTERTRDGPNLNIIFVFLLQRRFIFFYGRGVLGAKPTFLRTSACVRFLNFHRRRPDEASDCDCGRRRRGSWNSGGPLLIMESCWWWQRPGSAASGLAGLLDSAVSGRCRQCCGAVPIRVTGGRHPNCSSLLCSPRRAQKSGVGAKVVS